MQGPSIQQERILWHAAWLIGLFCVLGAAAVVLTTLFWLLIFFSGILIPLALAAILAVLLKPAIDWLTKKKQYSIKKATTLVWIPTIIGFFTILILVGLFFFALITDMPLIIDALIRALEELFITVPVLFAHDPAVIEQLTHILNQVREQWFELMLNTLIPGLITSVFNQLTFIAGVFLIPFYGYFFLLYYARIESSWKHYLPMRQSKLRDEVVFFLSEITKHTVVFFRSQVVVAVCVGAFAAVGLTLVGLKYGFFVGVFTGFITMIPVIGAILSVVPALTIAYMQSDGSLLYLLLVGSVFFLGSLLENLIITPRIQGKQAKLHPLAVIVAFMFWSAILGGIMGFIFAIPLTATLRVLMYRYVWSPPNKDAGPSASTEPVS